MPTRSRPLPARALPGRNLPGRNLPGRRPLRRRAASLLAVLAALLGLMLAGATAASAHAALLSTDPAENSVVQTAPAEVTLHFSEQVTLATDDLRVFDPNGKRVDAGPTGHAGSDDTTAQVRLATGLAQGTYTVAWRAISADTHPVSGAFTFSYGHASSTTAVAGEQATKGSALVGALYGGSRSVQYGSYALLVGAVVMVLACWPRGVRLRSVQRLMLVGWAGLLLATVAELLLRGPYAAASGLGGVFDLTLIQQSLGERLGTLLIVRVLLLAAVGVFLSLLAGQAGIGGPPAADADADVPEAGAQAPDAAEHRLRIGLGIGWAVLSIALACTWALGDHASVGIQVGLAVPLDVVHVLSMACWLGGLATVLVGLRRTEAEGGVGAAQVGRFSAIAMTCVAALVGTGVYQAWRGLGSWGALVTTTYGRLLLVKIGAVLIMLAAAWVSRRWTAVLRTQPAPEPAPEPEAAAEAEAAPEAEAPEAEADADAEAGSDDPVRRAQLARQRALRAGVASQRAREASPARTMLLRSVLLEVAFAVVVLVVTTLLTNAPPGREVTQQAAALAATQNQPVNVTLPYDTGGPGDNADGKVNIAIDPARTGPNTLHAYVFDRSGKPVDVPELDVTLSLAAKDLGPLTVPVAKVDLGHWAASKVELPLQGKWLMAVSIRSDAIDETTVSTTIQVG
ncbi:ABC transporter [Streptacidiphilus sp. PB12-B1b]|uniref:copper resistance protein CopC n=1 Tax=Streptacidiphilus sp. PB12-B1b TaxID=2705012 RepID=UPI0015FE576D|nr:copper resistance protein CopC [Streptacidiphilus sp. PB12-B1b]QMU74503.1 ABC transporter [Streptacidiphilus sp. PB12-B1b]